MEQLLNSIVLVLAVWRITSILQREKVFEAVRARFFGEVFDETLGVYRYKDTFMGHLIQCFWCVSVWVSLLVVPLWLYDVRLLLPFAASAAAIMLEQKVM